MDDVFYNILTFLGVKNILSCSLVSKLLNKICHSQMIWKHLVKYNYGDVPIIKNNYYEIYKISYKLNEFTQNNYYDLPIDNTDTIYDIKYIYLTCYPVIAIPTEIGYLHNLIQLVIENNLIKIIPTEIGKLLNLERLKLTNNYITTIPTEFGLLQKLNQLYLDNNKIKSLPTELGKLHNLRVLNVCFNKNIIIPTELNIITNLRIIKS
jgi:Leucine-rich repeat (LRR) protein